MTSLSHDVKTPLASLVGYLEAVTENLVAGEEKETYIQIAAEKAHQLKEFVESLFEWVKLDAGEQVYHFEQLDFNELSRNIMADWIPTLENSHFEYDIDIPENEYFMKIDVRAYIRILNNLIQNIVPYPFNLEDVGMAFWKLFVPGITCLIAVMPIIVLFTLKRNWYPTTSGLTIIKYEPNSSNYQMSAAIFVLAVCVFFSLFIITVAREEAL